MNTFEMIKPLSLGIHSLNAAWVICLTPVPSRVVDKDCNFVLHFVDLPTMLCLVSSNVLSNY